MAAAPSRRVARVPPAVRAALLAGLTLGSSLWLGERAVSFVLGRSPHQAATSSSRLLPRRAKKLVVNEEEWLEVWEQSVQDLALDVRELLISDANLYFVGPDTESYRDAIMQVAEKLNYTATEFAYRNAGEASQDLDAFERCYLVQPLDSTLRWPWNYMYQGLTIWLDPDGYRKLDLYQRDRIQKMKYTRKKPVFGPATPPIISLTQPSEVPLSDPLDTWMECDVHVDLTQHTDLPLVNVILGNIIEAILASPPKWRGWMKAAKIRGTIPADYETPLQIQRAHFSYGISPRLNRLLNA